jgi:hypothetical protein
MITGDVTLSQRADILQLIATASGKSLVRAQMGDSLALADRPDSILVVDALDGLSPDEQQELYRWLDRHPHQVISFATTSIYPSVETGSFSAKLFYRLNVITTTLDTARTVSKRGEVD